MDFREAMLLPVNFGGATLALFALFKAYHGERAPAALVAIKLSIFVTIWAVATTKTLQIKQAKVAGALLITNVMIVATLVLNGYGSR